MKQYADEFEGALINSQSLANYSELSADQVLQVRNFSVQRIKKLNSKSFQHNLINTLVFLILILAQVVIYLSLKNDLNALSLIIISSLAGYCNYNVVVFSMHEGAYHHLLFKGSGVVAKFFNYLGNNSCRLLFSDPIHYKKKHHSHHIHFGTTKDEAFTNFVRPKRMYKSFLPLAGVLSFNDYKIHTPDKLTISSFMSLLIGLSFLGLITSPLWLAGYWIKALIFIVISTWVTFSLDRIRESTEHQLMSLDKYSGARNFGLSFWGILIGGGPWGQNCHLSHHLAPGLPWYEQIHLNSFLKTILSKRQKKHFIHDGFFNFISLTVEIFNRNKMIYSKVKSK